MRGADEQHSEDMAALPTAKPSWRAWQLGWFSLGSLLFIEVGIAATLIGLDSYSRKHHGFVSVTPESVSDVNEDYFWIESLQHKPFLWTTLPTLLMSLFGLAFGSVVSSYAEEMPFRELQEREGSTLRKSVLLDYRRFNELYNWFMAWKNRHLLLGSCMFLSLLIRIALVPIAARLFEIVNPRIATQVFFSQTSRFNDAAPVSGIDYAPILGAVSVVSLYGGSWPAWTDGFYSIASLDLPRAATEMEVTRLEVETEAYAAMLDCEVLNKYNIVKSSESGLDATITLDATDRGCKISLGGSVGGSSKTYLKMEAITDCAARAGHSRIAFYAGSYSSQAPFLLDNMSVVSCIPQYRRTKATVSAPAAFQPIFFDVSGTAVDARNSNFSIFEQDMLALTNIGNSNSADYTSQFGQIVLDTVTKLHPHSSLSTEVLISCASSVFSSVFAVFATLHLLQPLPIPEDIPGSVTTVATRLATVAWSTYVSIAFMAILIATTGCIAMIVQRKPPVLTEDPRGILGAANILYGSNMEIGIRAARQAPDYNGKLHDWLENTYLLGEERCKIDQDGVVRVRGLRPKSSI